MNWECTCGTSNDAIAPACAACGRASPPGVGRLIGDAALASLSGVQVVRVHAVARGTAPAARVAGIGVSRSVALDAAASDALRAALADDALWDLAAISRHRALPDTLFELGSVVVALDRRGGKLGVVRGGLIPALDFQKSAAPTQVLFTVARLVDAVQEGG